jgi:hypothetical protein
MSVDELLNKLSYFNLKANENMNNFETEDQIGGDMIGTLDSQAVNNMPDDEQVCIYDLSIRSSFI